MAGWKGGRPYCWRGGWISAEARSACALGGDRAAEVGLVRFPKNPRVTPAEYDRADVPGDEEPRLRDRDGADPGNTLLKKPGYATLIAMTGTTPEGRTGRQRNPDPTQPSARACDLDPRPSQRMDRLLWQAGGQSRRSEVISVCRQCPNG